MPGGPDVSAAAAAAAERPPWWRELWRPPRQHADDWRGLFLVAAGSVAVVAVSVSQMRAEPLFFPMLLLAVGGLVAGQLAEVLPPAWRRPAGVLRALRLLTWGGAALILLGAAAANS
ncbi:MAG TPA: hypothetical protein VGE07_28100 [Herpetosiphonaceae bacterium]